MACNQGGVLVSNVSTFGKFTKMKEKYILGGGFLDFFFFQNGIEKNIRVDKPSRWGSIAGRAKDNEGDF